MGPDGSHGAATAVRRRRQRADPPPGQAGGPKPGRAGHGVDRQGGPSEEGDRPVRPSDGASDVVGTPRDGQGWAVLGSERPSPHRCLRPCVGCTERDRGRPHDRSGGSARAARNARRAQPERA
ncbi:hypothetical protein FTX61_14575 [Nitriliruptoraceae bacterium ZYF776]|nr:hypothetical protein [Profundirhabdus halotolerans]